MTVTPSPLTAAANAAREFPISGEVSAANFRSWQQQGEAWIEATDGDLLHVDCSGLSRANSLVVALLLALLRHADGQGKALEFAQVSPALTHIIEFSGLSRVLAVS